MLSLPGFETRQVNVCKLAIKWMSAMTLMFCGAKGGGCVAVTGNWNCERGISQGSVVARCW